MRTLLLITLIPVESDSKIQSRASSKYADNWDSIFGKKEDPFKAKRPSEMPHGSNLN